MNNINLERQLIGDAHTCPDSLLRRNWNRAIADGDTDLALAVAERPGLPEDIETAVANTTTLPIRLAWIARTHMDRDDVETLLANDRRASVTKAAVKRWNGTGWAAMRLLDLFDSNPTHTCAQLILAHVNTSLLNAHQVIALSETINETKLSAAEKATHQRLYSSLHGPTASKVCAWAGAAQLPLTTRRDLLLSPGRADDTIAADTVALAGRLACGGREHRTLLLSFDSYACEGRLNTITRVNTVIETLLDVIDHCNECNAQTKQQAHTAVDAWRDWTPPEVGETAPPEKVLPAILKRYGRCAAPQPGTVTIWDNNYTPELGYAVERKLVDKLEPYLNCQDERVAAAAWKVAARCALLPNLTSYHGALERFADDEDTTAHLYLLLGVGYHIYWDQLPGDVAEALLLDYTRGHPERFGNDETDWCATNGRAGLVPWERLFAHLRSAGAHRSMNRHGNTIVEKFTNAIETSGQPEEMWQLVNTYADTHNGSAGELLAVCADISGATIIDPDFTEHGELPPVVRMTRAH